MTEWIALSRSQHAEHGYTPRTGYHHATEQMAVPVLLAELPKLLPHYVLGFVKHNDTLTPMAILGLQEGENLYLHPDGRWLGSYVPSTLRSYPFALARTPHSDQTLVIDAAHLTEDDHATQLFEDDGELAEPVAKTLAFLEQCAQNRVITQQATNALEQAGVLTPWTLTLTINDTPRALQGLYRVDEQALNRLSAETLATLQGAPMTLAYAQLFSTHQGEQLRQRAALQEKIAEAQPPVAQRHLHSVAQTDDVSGLFGEADDELTFDFDQ